MYSRNADDRIEDLERDVEHLARVVQCLDEPTGTTENAEYETRIQEMEVDYTGLDARVDGLTYKIKRLEQAITSLEALVASATDTKRHRSACDEAVQPTDDAQAGANQGAQGRARKGTLLIRAPNCQNRA